MEISESSLVYISQTDSARGAPNGVLEARRRSCAPQVQQGDADGGGGGGGGGAPTEPQRRLFYLSDPLASRLWPLTIIRTILEPGRRLAASSQPHR
jgi:hypothetical protein